MLPVIQNQDFLPFQFEGLRLKEACFINGNPHFTGRGIGEFLEYDHPDRAIHKIIERNPHIKEFSVTLKLRVTDEFERTYSLVKMTNEHHTRNREIEVRVYDPIGLQLIINKSNQPKAIAFQIAVAHLVLAFMHGKVKPKIWSPDRISAIRQILSAPPTFKRSDLVAGLALREGVSRNTVYKWVGKHGDLKNRKGNIKRTSLKGRTKYPDIKATTLFIKAQMPGYGPKRIASIIGKPDFFENVKRWVKAA